MAGPFYQPIKGTTSGTPGTGAFTPNAASAGFLAWSTMPTGWWGLVRFEDGSAWELTYSYWNGATLSRSATQDVSSSTGSLLTLTSAATATLVCDGARVQPNLIMMPRGYQPIPNASTTPTALGLPAATVTGTAQAGAIANGGGVANWPRSQSISATTANAQAGYTTTTVCGMTSSTAGCGGWLFNCRTGSPNVLPTGYRLFIGMTSITRVGLTTEPSASVAHTAAFAKDSTDTNIQLLVNSNAGAGTKTDTGIAFGGSASAIEAWIWSDPGSLLVKALLVDVTLGTIFYAETSTDVPTTGAMMFPQLLGGLSATTGVAIVMAMGGMFVQAGGW